MRTNIDNGHALVGVSKMIVDDDRTVSRWYTREALEAGTELPANEVARGIYELRVAESRGFLGCRAVYVNMRYDSLHVCAEPNNPSKDWGRSDLYLRAFWRDGAIVRDPSYPTPPHEWEGVESGYPCHIHVNYSGARCGYVALPSEHPAFGKHYDDDILRGIEVHGGLTYAQEEGGAWVLGFDCSHYCDKGHPEYEHGNRYGFGDGTYRSQEYVRAEIASLAKQLRVIAEFPNAR